jgi:hypothetical protein
VSGWGTAGGQTRIHKVGQQDKTPVIVSWKLSIRKTTWKGSYNHFEKVDRDTIVASRFASISLGDCVEHLTWIRFSHKMGPCFIWNAFGGSTVVGFPPEGDAGLYL